jgi:biofilm PGA synthesis N-glycosyltransferase PgaC
VATAKTLWPRTCDLSLQLHRSGWRVTQDDDAVAFTEAPATVDDLLKQRIRWTFGTMQAITKNRDMLFNRRYGWLGMFVLPWYMLSVLVPLLTLPLVAVMALVAVRTSGGGVVLLYFAAFTAAHAITAAVGLRLAGADLRQMLIVPAYRIVYEPLRAYLLYACAFKALQGRKVGWNKLVRTGAMDDHGAAATRTEPGTEPARSLPARTPAVVIDLASSQQAAARAEDQDELVVAGAGR